MTTHRSRSLPNLAHAASLACAALCCALSLGAQAALELGSPFVDDMVLQRELPVAIWGWAPAETEVTVRFAGQRRRAVAGPQGRWQVELAPLQASAEERELAVSAQGLPTLTRRGVLVGEVWFSSGQSNMDWVAGKSMCGPRQPTAAQRARGAAPRIRGGHRRVGVLARPRDLEGRLEARSARGLVLRALARVRP